MSINGHRSRGPARTSQKTRDAKLRAQERKNTLSLKKEESVQEEVVDRNCKTFGLIVEILINSRRIARLRKRFDLPKTPSIAGRPSVAELEEILSHQMGVLLKCGETI